MTNAGIDIPYMDPMGDVATTRQWAVKAALAWAYLCHLVQMSNEKKGPKRLFRGFVGDQKQKQPSYMFFFSKNRGIPKMDCL